MYTQALNDALKATYFECNNAVSQYDQFWGRNIDVNTQYISSPLAVTVKKTVPLPI